MFLRLLKHFHCMIEIRFKKNKQIFDVQDYKALKAPKTIMFWCHNSSRSLFGERFYLKISPLKHVHTKLDLTIQEISLGKCFAESMQGFSQEKGICFLARPSMFNIRKMPKTKYVYVLHTIALLVKVICTLVHKV